MIDSGLGENIVDLGMLYYVAVEESCAAHVVMTTTIRGPAISYIEAGACDSASSVSGIVSVEVALTWPGSADG